jgi:hypothetical protein
MSFYGAYLNIQDSNATPGSTFLADNTCVDNGNNLGWTFNSGPFLFPNGFGLTSAVGTSVAQADSNLSLTGVQVATATNSVTTRSDNYVGLDGIFVYVTTPVETLQTQSSNNLSLTGVSSTLSLGTEEARANADVYVFNGELYYLDIQDSIASGNPIPFYAGASVDSGNNVNWSIDSSPISGIISTRLFAGLAETESENFIDVTGVSSTVTLGTPITIANAVVNVTGEVITTSLGTVVVTANASATSTGVLLTGFVGTVIAKNIVDVLVNGVQTTSALGTAVATADANTLVTGLLTTSALGNETVNTTQFNYNAVSALYDRKRTVYVNRRSTSQDRTVYVA